MFYAEIGIGNDSFISTEIEKGEEEYRINSFFVSEIRSFYLRMMIGHRIFIIDTKNGLVLQRKPYKKFKLLFGVTSF